MARERVRVRAGTRTRQELGRARAGSMTRGVEAWAGSKTRVRARDG